MGQKIVVIADPGIDTAFAIALALHDPQLDVVGLIATAGNVSAERATQNLHVLVNQIDAQRWPRVGAALPVEYEIDGTQLHGPGGLGGVTFPPISLHNALPGDKLLIELVRKHPKEITVVVMGPCTVLACAMERDPDLPNLLEHVVILGGTHTEPGNATAMAEFHFLCDPAAARRVLQSGVRISLLPLDVTRKLIFSPSDLLELPCPGSPTCEFLRKIVPFGIRATSNLYGIEGFHLKDVLGIVELAVPDAVQYQTVHADIELHGELTRGMLVVDGRPNRSAKPNIHLAVGVDTIGVRDYIGRILGSLQGPR